jgi:uncharacterized Zn finger protein (UPF0148 family)
MNRRCPHCNGWLWHEPGRVYCSLCWWESYPDKQAGPGELVRRTMGQIDYDNRSCGKE